MRVLGPAEIAARIDERLRFVSRRVGAPPRQRTLRDTVAWSHELLPSPTQRVFARLGVFATTFSLEAAGAVSGEDDVLEHIAALVDHSLLAREPEGHGTVRYRMLDTLRLFALEQVADSAQSDAALRAHAEFYLRLLETAGPRLFGPDERRWAKQVEIEEPNVHAALAWAAERDRVLALRLGVAMWPYWDLRWREGYAVSYFTSVLDADGPPVPDALRAWSLTAMADLVANPGEARLATGWAGDALRLFRALGDDHGVAAALLAMGSACGNAGSLDAAESALDEAMALARRIGDSVLLARGLNFTSFVATRRGDHRRAEALTREELAVWSRVGSGRGEATALRHIAVALQHQDDLDQAMRLCGRALIIWRRLEDAAAVAHVKLTEGDIMRLRGDRNRAQIAYEEALAEFRRIGDRRCTASTNKNLALLAHAREDYAHSSALYVEAIRLRHELGDHAGLAECFAGLAGNLAATGRHAAAETLLAAADQRRRTSGTASFRDEEAAAGLVESTVRAALPAPRRAQARAKGHGLSLEEAVAFAVAFDPARAGPRG